MWPDRLTEHERRVLEATGWGARQGFGSRPAVLVVDVTYGFTGDRPEPILEAVKTYPTSCGEVAWPALEAIDSLLNAARAADVQVIYTRNEYREDGWDLGSWAWKMDRKASLPAASGARQNDIVELIAPQDKDIVISKKKPSAFYGTPLMAYLTDLHVDQLIVAGCVTSGCVRASVLDAFSNNLRVAVVADGTFDRIPLSHEVALFEMNAKYADVVSLGEAVAYLQSARETRPADGEATR